MGRKKLPIDPEHVKELARIGCTKTEAAIMLGCSVDTLDRRFAEFFQLGDVQGRTQLRRRQHERAVEGSDNMLIFLGKNRLGQEDAREEGGLSHEQHREILAAIAQARGIIPAGDRSSPDEGV